MYHALNASFSTVLPLLFSLFLSSCGSTTYPAFESQDPQGGEKKSDGSETQRNPREGNRNLAQGQTVVIHQASTTAFSPTSSQGYYGGCGSLFKVTILDERSASSFGYSNIYFVAEVIPKLNVEYKLTRNTQGLGNAPLENSAGIKMGSNIDTSPYLDDLTSGVITFQSVSNQALGFTFSMFYADGKVLTGTVNQPLLPGPTHCN